MKRNNIDTELELEINETFFEWELQNLFLVFQSKAFTLKKLFFDFRILFFSFLFVLWHFMFSFFALNERFLFRIYIWLTYIKEVQDGRPHPVIPDTIDIFWLGLELPILLRVLPTVEILNIRPKCEIKAYLTGRNFLLVSGRVKRTLVPG